MNNLTEITVLKNEKIPVPPITRIKKSFKSFFDPGNVLQPILDHLSTGSFDPIVLMGENGVGKKYLASLIAKSLERPYTELNNINKDNAVEQIGEALKTIGTNACTIIIHKPELDDNVLKNLLENPSSFEYNQYPLDLSNTFFIINTDLESDFLPCHASKIEIKQYTNNQKITICSKYLVPKIRKKYGLNKNTFKITERAIKYLVQNTQGYGVSILLDKLHQLAKHIVYKKQTSKQKIIINHPFVYKFFDANIEIVTRKNPGFCPIIGVNESGAGFLYVQSDFSKIGDMIITGTKDENVSYMCKNALHIMHKYHNNIKQVPVMFYFSEDITGDSCGVSIFMSIYNLTYDFVIPETVAFTGAIDLHGNLKEIGSVYEKLVACLNSNIKHFFLPTENKKDFNEIKHLIDNSIEIHWCNHIDEIIEYSKDNWE